MEAIVELIAAMFEAFGQALVALLEMAVALLAMVVEFLFLAITQGVAAASAKFKQRQQQRAEKRAEAASTPPGNGDSPAGRPAPRSSRRVAAIAATMAALVAIAIAVTWVVQEHLRKRRMERIAATRDQIARLADTFVDQIQDDKVADPNPGRLEDRDAWQQPLELFVDQALLGSMVVVRSNGPDGKSGTIDDLLAVRLAKAPAKKVGRELANRGAKAIRDRVGRLLPEKEKAAPER